MPALPRARLLVLASTLVFALLGVFASTMLSSAAPAQPPTHRNDDLHPPLPRLSHLTDEPNESSLLSARGDLYCTDDFTLGFGNGQLTALAEAADGTLYIGGFVAGITLETMVLYSWDGTTQTNMAPSVPGVVKDLKIGPDGMLYVAGVFYGLGGLTGNIARWDGTSWELIDEGLTSGEPSTAVVLDLAFATDGTLYAGGAFRVSNGAISTGIAKWDGNSWSALGSGLNSTARALEFTTDGTLFVGGDFTMAGSSPANHVAKWDGTAWSALGQGTNDGVTSLAASPSGTLFVGGYFNTAGGVAANAVAKWDGTSWQSLSTGMDSSVYDLELDSQGRVYARGSFSQAGNVAALGVARWDGTTWSALGEGAHGFQALLIGSDDLPLTADGVLVVHWDGDHWIPVGGNGVDGVVHAVAITPDGSVFIGGQFETAGNSYTTNIARWNGTSWSAVGDGVNGTVYALAVDGAGTLFAGGQFTQAGGAPANHIARWDGSTWSALGQGVAGGDQPAVRALTFADNGTLFVGGTFTHAGGQAAVNLATWDGANWNSFGDPSGVSSSGNPIPSVNAITFGASGALYVGGNFDTIGALTGHSIARWDGTSWMPLGAGIEGEVKSLLEDSDGMLNVGGTFTAAGSIPVPNFAQWDGTSWLTSAGFSGNFEPGVFTLVENSSNDLLIGGSFGEHGGLTVNNMAMLHAGVVEPVGVGTTGPVFDMALRQVSSNREDIWIGGDFYSAGGVSSYNISRCSLTAPTALFVNRMDASSGIHQGALALTLTLGAIVVGLVIWRRRDR